MSQLNIHMTPAFEEILARFMKSREIRTKSAAIRIAVEEALERQLRDARTTDFTSWLGAGTKVPENPKRKFAADDDLWK